MAMTRRAPRPASVRHDESGLVDLNLSARQPSVVAPGADIPELRKQEKEKKAGGIFWRAASPGGGGTLARAAAPTAWGPPGFSRLAVALGERLNPASLAGRLLLSRAGGWVLLSAILAVGGVAGLGVGLRVGGPRLVVKAVAGTLGLGGVQRSSGSPKSSLEFVASANRGAFNEPAPAAPADAASPAGEAPLSPTLDAAAPAEAPLTADAAGGGEGPLANAAGSRRGEPMTPRPLMASAGGMMGGGSAAPAAAAARLATPVPQADPNRGKLSGLSRERGRSSASSLRTQRGRSERAMGQLKLARNQSYAGSSASRETAAKQYATNAFEQAATQGGALAGGLGAMDGPPQVVVPPGQGAPDVDNSTPKAPEVGPYKESTPYQDQLDAAKEMADQAGKLRMMGMLMMVLGAGMIAAGVYLLQGNPEPTTKYIAYGMIAGGTAMVGMGVMMLAQAQNMAKQAEAMGKQIQQQDQQAQGQIATDHAQAKADGREYAPPDLSDKTKDNADLHQAVQEESQATYKLGP